MDVIFEENEKEDGLLSETILAKIVGDIKPTDDTLWDDTTELETEPETDWQIERACCSLCDAVSAGEVDASLNQGHICCGGLSAIEWQKAGYEARPGNYRDNAWFRLVRKI